MLRIHTPISFKVLKELKTACTQYSPKVPFTQTVLENIEVETLPLVNWKQIAKACLPGGDYLLWKTEFEEQCQATVERNRAQQVPISNEMLAGEGPCRGADQRLEFDMTAYVKLVQQPGRPGIFFCCQKNRLRSYPVLDRNLISYFRTLFPD